jgi:hypothetical protein
MYFTEETHITTEASIRPCAAKMAQCILDAQVRKKLETIHLLNNTVYCRIQELSANIKHKLVQQPQSCNGFPCKQTNQQTF